MTEILFSFHCCRSVHTSQSDPWSVSCRIYTIFMLHFTLSSFLSLPSFSLSSTSIPSPPLPFPTSSSALLSLTPSCLLPFPFLQFYSFLLYFALFVFSGLCLVCVSVSVFNLSYVLSCRFQCEHQSEPLYSLIVLMCH